ncbi:MAG: hypothetical protein NTW87_33655 [Planctomycetota bacterium]|nr:hypothetical protein [Planctomycetota bacterium]
MAESEAQTPTPDGDAAKKVAVGTPGPAFADDALDRGPYVDGFSARTVLGAVFVAFVMMPGAIYMGLVAGQSLGSAAEWVTIILFAELARRSFARLRRQEVFVLFYVASGIAAVTFAHLALAGGPFAATIWNQFLLQAPETSSIAPSIPDWVVPPVTSPAIQERNLAHVDWWWSSSKGFLSPVVLIAMAYVLSRLGAFGLGYLVFRLTSDVERLPFPLAPIAAEGATALAESTEREDTPPVEGAAPSKVSGILGYFAARGSQRQGRGKRSWRWNVFSVGASFGVAFGCVYVLVPVVSGLILSKPIMILPIPFVDFTANVEGVLPASLISISFDAALFLAGMVLPFKLIGGTFTAVILTSVIGGPILLKLGAFKHWTPGNGLLVNQMLLSFDLWMSVSVGLAGAVLFVGIWTMVKVFAARHAQARAAPGAAGETKVLPRTGLEPPYRTACRQRGDFPTWAALGLCIFSIVSFSVICRLLVPGFPLWLILIFGFLWTPLHSYISARLVGLTGMGWMSQRFRELELTRTRFTSLIKAELVMLPVIFVSSFLFWWFFWHLNQVPSGGFPFAARLWPVAARQACLIFTANSSESPLLLQALNPKIILGACAAGLVLYRLVGAVGLPAVFFYGMIGGVGAPLHAGLSLFVGALVGRYYFRRRFGEEAWSRYVPVAAAGFSCGMGLAAMLAVSLSLVAQCARDLPF